MYWYYKVKNDRMREFPLCNLRLLHQNVCPGYLQIQNITCKAYNQLTRLGNLGLEFGLVLDGEILPDA